MDLQHAQQLLEKISALLKSMQVDHQNVAAIERDLMLSYIRNLYENFLDTETPAPQVKKAAPAEPVRPSRPVEEVMKKYTPPRIIEIPDSVKEMSNPAPAPVEKVTPVPPQPTPVTPPAPKVVTPPVAVKPPVVAAAPLDDEVESLFAHQEARELSERLGESPVQDLSKAMGLNDRLLVINDLFGGDQQAYQQAINSLNGFRQFEEARAYLAAEVISRFNWTNKNKIGKAKEFIKLVRRRYKNNS